MDSVDKVLKVFVGFAAGLEHLHRIKLVHRTSSRKNLLLDDAYLKICDFGIAKSIFLCADFIDAIYPLLPENYLCCS